VSAKAGTIQGTRLGVSWPGAWIAALLLTVLLAVAMFAMTRTGGDVVRTPTTARFGVTEQLSGGPAHVVRQAPRAPAARPGIQIGDTICHQCR
jgi:hypothetical protein